MDILEITDETFLFNDNSLIIQDVKLINASVILNIKYDRIGIQ